MAQKDLGAKVKEMSLKDSRISGKDYLFLNMVKDRKTEMYVKAAKTIVLFQGPVSQERQHITRSIAEKFKNSSRILSDETYRKETFGCFNAEQTDKFHEYFRREFKRACEEGSNLIVIDASLTHLQQLEFYFYLAQQFQYVVLVVPPLVTVDVTSSEQFKNVKMSQAQSLLKSGARLSSVSGANTFDHFFCAWFLHEADSVSLRQEASLYMQDCFKDIERFAQIYKQVCTIDDFETYFNLVDRRQDLAYCVVTVFDRWKSTVDYFARKCVNELYGKMSKLIIIGFIISPKVIAARVRLSHKQKELWDMPHDWDENQEKKPVHFASEKLQESKISLQEDCRLIAMKANPTLVNFGDPLLEPLRAVDLNARGRSCHIVLGKAPKTPYMNADYDVHFAVSRERKLRLAKPDAIEPLDLGRSIVFHIGKYWYIYLKQYIVVDGFLATCGKPLMFKDK